MITTEPAAAPPHQPCILVADDNQVNQLVTRRILEGLGCTVTIATNGLEAVARACERPYDLVLMDLQMPEMDGMEATRAIRELATHQPIVIAFSAYVSTENLVHCRGAGMDDFLGKPVRKEDLERTIGHWLEVIVDRNSRPAREGVAGHLAQLLSDTDPEFVREIAELFVRTGEELVRTAERTVTSGEFPQAVLAIHSLKGAAGNLGAKELMELCAALEAQGREGTLTPEAVRALEQRFREAAGDIGRFFCSLPADVPVPPAPGVASAPVEPPAPGIVTAGLP